MNSKSSNFFDDLLSGKFKFLYLLGSENLRFDKRDTFVIYQGSHGDKGAEMADVILPSPAYTEHNGLFSNVEGRIQECRKASYPPGLAKEDYKIFNLLNQKLIQKNIYESFNEIRKEVLGHLTDFEKIGSLPKQMKMKNDKVNKLFHSEKIVIEPIDYYYTNSISRSSKTMSECRNIRTNGNINGVAR